MKGDGHLYIVRDANGTALPRTYKMRGLAKEKARSIGGTVDIIPDGVRRKVDAGLDRESQEAPSQEAQGKGEGEAEENRPVEEEPAGA
jgi:hypothetical protein